MRVEGDDDTLDPGDEPEPAATRERFGRYELVAELASGGMATVYLARLLGDAGVARVVALKRIHPHLARRPGFAEMFLDEARIASRIDHPNVCQVLEYGRERDTSFLTMELLAGETLARIGGAIARGGAPELRARLPALVATVIAEACDGLQAAHDLCDAQGRSLRVVHRDISPQNLIVTFDGGVKVVDFGVASAANKLTRTETGMVRGKLAYMPPEQLAGRVDPRADVWALGVVLWELLTIKRLFRRATPAETIAAVERDPLAPPSAIRPELGEAYDAIVMRALARDPATRYASARELGRDLRAAVRAQGDVIDRAALAEWMSALFPDGAQRRRAWLELAERGEPIAAPPTPEPSRPTEASPAAASPAAASLAEPSQEVEATTAEAPAPPPRRRPLVVPVAVAAVLLASTAVLMARSTPGEPAAPLAIATPSPPPAIDPPVPAPIEAAPMEAAAMEAAPTEIAPPPVPAPEPPAPPRRARAARTERAAAPPEPTASEPACLLVAAGIRVHVAGASHEGPIGARQCVRVPPGAHELVVADLATGQTLWSRRHQLASGTTRRVTRSGLAD